MKVGRNDPCPCGSGKKYKKCCMRKDEELAHKASSMTRVPETPKPPTPETPEPPPPDPHIQAINAHWERFKAEDYEGQIALFLRTLDEEELMDEEMAFEMLNTIHSEAIENNERDRFDGLVETLRERLPDIYAHDAQYYLDWRIRNAVTAGRWEVVSDLAKEMGAIAGDSIDTFNNVVDLLAYHGQLSTLVETMRIAWPGVEHSAEIVPWGVDEFAQQAVNFVMFDYVERHPSPDANDPEFREQLGSYLEILPDRLAQYIAHLTGQADRSWTMSDFEFRPPRSRSSHDFDEEEDDEDRTPDEARENLFHLTVEFLGHLRREENVSYTRGELGRKHIEQYILERHAGELEPREGMLEAMMRPKRRRPKPRSRKPDHVLCPDHDTLDRYLAGLLGFINPQYYKAAATFELMPAWLSFLESRQLINDEQHRKTVRELRSLFSQLLDLWKKHTSDPALERGIKRAWEQVSDAAL